MYGTDAIGFVDAETLGAYAMKQGYEKWNYWHISKTDELTLELSKHHDRSEREAWIPSAWLGAKKWITHPEVDMNYEFRQNVNELLVGQNDDDIFIETWTNPIQKTHIGGTGVYTLYNQRDLIFRSYMHDSDGEPSIAIIDLQNGDELDQLPGQKQTLLSFSSDGRHFLTQELNGSVYLWRNRRPEWWWGHFYRPETYTTFLLFITLIWSLLRDRKTFRRTILA